MIKTILYQIKRYRLGQIAAKRMLYPYNKNTPDFKPIRKYPQNRGG